MNLPTRHLRATTLLVCLMMLSACATPRVSLKHPRTGQVAVCGGTATGSLLGGYIGHNVQKKDDAECVKNYESRGFKRVD